MGEHTEGPWTTILNDFGSLPTNHYLAIYGADRSCVAHALVLKQFYEGSGEHPVKANASLIAAAPDMLKALEATKPVLEAMQRIFIAQGLAKDHIAGGPLNQMIENAIAKATGKSTDTGG